MAEGVQEESAGGVSSQCFLLPVTLQTSEARSVCGLETSVKFWTIIEEKCLNIFLILMPVTRTNYWRKELFGLDKKWPVLISLPCRGI